MLNFLGTDLPIIQAPMAGVQDSRLAAAVSNAGGLGSLPCAMLTAAALRAELEALKGSTNRPFNLNFFAHTPPEPDTSAEKSWRAALAPYYREYGLDEGVIANGPGRQPFNTEMAAIVEEFRPAVVSFHFGLPAPELLQRVKAAGATVLSSATTVEEALWLEGNGADGIIAQGLEAGGHRGIFLTKDMSTQMGTFALLPQVVAAVSVPVIAAGGIADARGVKAALALGAAAAQVGTAFMLCPEATTRAVHREALKSDAARHTAITNLFSGGPARGIMNRVMRELGPISALAPAFPLATNAIAPLRAAAEAQGSGDFSPLWCGQNASGCLEVPAAELLRNLAQGSN
ncbi:MULTISPECIES: NAD(P)H-dependent flavin oxidoreductase [Marinobacter]|jgi:nitronate monooxygenase|uniref:Nitronate monooxygenase n=1 Tax=Marinobacter excellens LAMA 842 TaxID=1306954 RepID=A0A137SD16_9GAMM|nr:MULTISPECIES: nitronate monooxygenase [Marinobacter]KXO10298.1 Enoyl-[acyl-carrier-protein] reductase [Marinobacter excellens LAMA 842]BEH14150.1 2-nitropropane dioxygenase [Marinobacter shengliensis]